MNKEEQKALKRIGKKLDDLLDKVTKHSHCLSTKPEKSGSSDEQASTSFAERQGRRASPKRGK